MDTELLYSKFPELMTDRLILRQIVPDDYTALFDIFSRPEVTSYYNLDTFQTTDPAKALVDSFIRRFHDRRGIRWGIVSKANSKLIGTCGLQNLVDQHSRAEIGYDLRPDFWRSGIMSEAIKEVLRFCFKEILLNRIEALCMPGNNASISLLKKYNFQIEGTVRQFTYWKGQYHDLVLLSLLHSECKLDSSG